jgi:sulfate transport system permease protein
MSLRVQQLYEGYESQAAFSVASLLLFLAFVTLAIKAGVEWRLRRQLAEAVRKPEAP